MLTVSRWTGLELVGFFLFFAAETRLQRALIALGALLYYSILVVLLVGTAAYAGAVGWPFDALLSMYQRLPLVGGWPGLIPVLWGSQVAITAAVLIAFYVGKERQFYYQRRSELRERLQWNSEMCGADNVFISYKGRLDGRVTDYLDSRMPSSESNRDVERAPGSPTPSSPEAKPDSPPPLEYKDDRQINAWVDELDDPKRPLIVDEAYTLNFQVDLARRDALVSGETVTIRPGDIPAAGLDTQWTVIATTVTFMPGSDGITTRTQQDGASTVSIAEFSLRIPASGPSARMSMRVTPKAAPDLRLDVSVHAQGELYRTFSVRLRVQATSGERSHRPTVRISRDTVFGPLTDLGIRPANEWKTPPGRLSLLVMSASHVHLDGVVNGQVVNDILEWSGAPARASGAIAQLQGAAEQLRETHQAYLDHISDQDLDAALAAFEPTYHWSFPVERIPPSSATAWAAVESSPELGNLAFYGYQLYDILFPAGTRLRTMLDQAPPGQRLDITWLDKVAHDGWMPNLPWALMHRVPAQAGQPVDAREFFGLRFRIDYATHGSQLKSRALGDIGSTYRAFGLYWGAQPGDETTAAAKWQASVLARFQHQVFVPDGDQGDAKPKLLRLLGTPGPAPMRLLYLFCQTDATSPTTPQLRFGSGRQPGDLLSIPEIGLQPFAEPPLVFLNACVSSGATAYQTNAFQNLFFQRGCSAYIGSETKVPIQFASRFAAVFFRFLYRDVDRHHEPIAAGEAFAQTRLFFWTHFRNIGGLLYNYVNEYDLFMASEKELEQWKAFQ